MKKGRKLQALTLSSLLLLNLTTTAFANQVSSGPAANWIGSKVGEGDIVVLYTNDVHTHIDNEGLRYSDVAAMKKELKLHNYYINQAESALAQLTEQMEQIKQYLLINIANRQKQQRRL